MVTIYHVIYFFPMFVCGALGLGIASSAETGNEGTLLLTLAGVEVGAVIAAVYVAFYF